jgi:hypothetical protein
VLHLGKQEHPSKTDGGEWRFAGVAELLPVYDRLEDGAEVLWKVRGRLPLSKIRSMVKSKKTLSVFDDKENVANQSPDPTALSVTAAAVAPAAPARRRGSS